MNEYQKLVSEIANKFTNIEKIMDSAEKKAIDLYGELDYYSNNDQDTFILSRILIQEIILELKFNNGDPKRIQYWNLVQDQLFKKYKNDPGQ
jgi:hypothetical protein